jgi:Mrp family chromosome partitioning ATPase/capsular polysaccharide biosynthesis protein
VTTGGARRPLLRAVSSHVVVVLLITAVTVVAAAIWSIQRSPTYEARATLLVSPMPRSDDLLGLPVVRDLGDPFRTVETAIAMLETEAITAATAERLGPGWTAGDVDLRTTLRARGQSNVIEVRAEATDPETSATLANAFVASALEMRRAELGGAVRRAITTLSAQLANLQEQGAADVAVLEDRLNALRLLEVEGDPTIRLLERAATPESSRDLPIALVVAVALLAGGALGTGAALVLDSTGPARLEDEDEIHTAMPGLSVLAGAPDRRTVTIEDPAWRNATRSVIVQLAGQTGMDVVMVTSPQPDRAKATTVVHLAVQLAEAGGKVIVIGLDPDDGRLMDRLGAVTVDGSEPPGPAGELLWAPLHASAAHPGVSVMDLTARGFSGVREHRLTDLLAAASEAADHVVVAAPSVRSAGVEVSRLASATDRVVLVVRLGHTERLEATRAYDLLVRTGTTPDGVLLVGP